MQSHRRLRSQCRNQKFNPLILTRKRERKVKSRQINRPRSRSITLKMMHQMRVVSATKSKQRTQSMIIIRGRSHLSNKRKIKRRTSQRDILRRSKRPKIYCFNPCLRKRIKRIRQKKGLKYISYLLKKRRRASNRS